MCLPCLQHSSTALNSGEPTGKYSILMVSIFLCRYFFTILDLCCVALSTTITNFLNFFLTCSRYSINDSLSNLSCCLKNCSPFVDKTPKTMVLSWDPVKVTTGLFSLRIHFLFLEMIESWIKIDSSCTRTFQPSLSLFSVFCILF